jgi:hypothetical protein
MIRLSSVSILTSAANCPVFTFERSNLKETLIGTLFINKPFADNKVNGDLFISAGILVICACNAINIIESCHPSISFRIVLRENNFEMMNPQFSYGNGLRYHHY